MASSTSEPVEAAVDSALVDYVLGLADDALIASHRLAEWIARAPSIEEDVAVGNIGLDLLGQARSLLTYAGQLAGAGQDEDALAYLRDAADFRNVQLVERPNGDFAVTMVRLLLFSSYQVELYGRLARSSDPTLAAVAAKAVKEVRYHRDHATRWVVRLGDGTEESRSRMTSALDAEWPYLGELFEPGEPALVASGAAVDPESLRDPVLARVGDVLSEATLGVPDVAAADTGGRGAHTEALGELLAEMQQLARAHPGATW
jgi:ring-1,2-phenylacetyl-CoA epoxidase subunit PaaC